MTKHTTLSRRGLELALAPSMKDKFGDLVKDLYDPKNNPEGFVVLGASENYTMVPEIEEYVKKNVRFDIKDFTYGEGPWGSQRLRKAMAKHMEKAFHSIEKLNPDQLVIATGVTSCCEILSFTLFDEGDGILLSRPIYQAFPIDFGVRGKAKPVYVPFGRVDQFSTDCVDKYEAALLKAEAEGTKIRAIMLCNPHNPLGKCYEKDAIIGLMKLCHKYKIHLIADEIYAVSVYDVPDENAVPFHSVLSFDHSQYIGSEYVHTLYGMSKDFACGGLRIGAMYTKNKELLHAAGVIGPFYWSGGPNDLIASTILEDEEFLDGYAKLSKKRLSERNVLSKSLLKDLGIEYASGANAGFFLWIDLRPFLPKESTDGKPFSSDWDREAALTGAMIKEKVFVNAGSELGAEEAGFFRIIFSQEEVVLKEGLKRLAKALGIKQKSQSLPLR